MTLQDQLQTACTNSSETTYNETQGTCTVRRTQISVEQGEVTVYKQNKNNIKETKHTAEANSIEYDKDNKEIEIQGEKSTIEINATPDQDYLSGTKYNKLRNQLSTACKGNNETEYLDAGDSAACRTPEGLMEIKARDNPENPVLVISRPRKNDPFRAIRLSTTDFTEIEHDSNSNQISVSGEKVRGKLATNSVRTTDEDRSFT